MTLLYCESHNPCSLIIFISTLCRSPKRSHHTSNSLPTKSGIASSDLLEPRRRLRREGAPFHHHRSAQSRRRMYYLSYLLKRIENVCNSLPIVLVLRNNSIISNQFFIGPIWCLRSHHSTRDGKPAGFGVPHRACGFLWHYHRWYLSRKSFLFCFYFIFFILFIHSAL